MRVVNMQHRKTRVNADLNGLGNSDGKKRILCIWRDLEGAVYHEILKSNEIINNARYQQHIANLSHTLIVKRPQWLIRPILPPYNATPHSPN
ncbi:hypothetical protein AVEN_117512-1 [Araneus ventricosus]|uniref:Uncharacterized protein n=1 Tax=Araneus ventricosus TaxID=182803 RepID=A0A4Y2GYF3_ARAVE|nr:hypothetical protein AVEN_117512-1 [Araneus ventricosus]